MVFVRRQELNNTTIRRLSLLLFLKKKAGGGSQCRIAIALAIWYNFCSINMMSAMFKRKGSDELKDWSQKKRKRRTLILLSVSYQYFIDRSLK